MKEQDMEKIIGNLLRIGVLIATFMVSLGGAIYISRHGLDRANYHIFKGVPYDLRNIRGIIENIISFHGRGFIQLGLILLIATPIARVVYSIYAFATQRDYLYTVVTMIVFVILVYGLMK